MTDWLMIAVGVVLTVGTALFVAGEFSLVALDPSTVETRAATGDKRATTVRRALGRLSTLLSGAQVGITLTTVLLGYTMQAALANLLTDLMSHWLATSVATGAAVVIALIVVNAFSMVIGELIPKNATLADPMRAAGLVAPFLMGFTTLLKPLIVLLNGAANAVLHAMGIEPAEELSGTRSAGELASLVRHSAEEGTLDGSTAALLTRSIGVSELTAVDVMTDRGRLHTLDAQDTADAVVALALVRALAPPPGPGVWLWVAAALAVGVGVAGLVLRWRTLPAEGRRWTSVAYGGVGLALVVVLA